MVMTDLPILDQQPDALIDIHAVTAATSLSKASVYRLMQAGRFPRSVDLMPGGRRVAWRQNEVRAWCSQPLDWGDPVAF